MATKRKTPQDRLPTAVQKPPPGAELLRPIGEIPIWDQAPLLELAAELHNLVDEAGSIEISNLETLKKLVGIIKLMRDFAIVREDWDKFCSGPPAQVAEKVAPILGWYLVGELGN